MAFNCYIILTATRPIQSSYYLKGRNLISRISNFQIKILLILTLSPILTLISGTFWPSERKKIYNFADSAKIREIKFRENFFEKRERTSNLFFNSCPY